MGSREQYYSLWRLWPMVHRDVQARKRMISWFMTMGQGDILLVYDMLCRGSHPMWHWWNLFCAFCSLQVESFPSEPPYRLTFNQGAVPPSILPGFVNTALFYYPGINTTTLPSSRSFQEDRAQKKRNRAKLWVQREGNQQVFWQMGF